MSLRVFPKLEPMPPEVIKVGLRFGVLVGRLPPQGRGGSEMVCKWSAYLCDVSAMSLR